MLVGLPPRGKWEGKTVLINVQNPCNKGSRGVDQPTTSSKARGSRDVGNPNSSSEARGFRDLGKPTISKLKSPYKSRRRLINGHLTDLIIFQSVRKNNIQTEYNEISLAS